MIIPCYLPTGRVDSLLHFLGVLQKVAVTSRPYQVGKVYRIVCLGPHLCCGSVRTAIQAFVEPKYFWFAPMTLTTRRILVNFPLMWQNWGCCVEPLACSTEVTIHLPWVRTKHFSPQKEHVVFRVCDTERIRLKCVTAHTMRSRCGGLVLDPRC